VAVLAGLALTDLGPRACAGLISYAEVSMGAAADPFDLAPGITVPQTDSEEPPRTPGPANPSDPTLPATPRGQAAAAGTAGAPDRPTSNPNSHPALLAEPLGNVALPVVFLPAFAGPPRTDPIFGSIFHPPRRGSRHVLPPCRV
jgi:hypothetical protein